MWRRVLVAGGMSVLAVALPAGRAGGDGTDTPGASGALHAREAAFHAALGSGGFSVRTGSVQRFDPITEIYDAGIGDSANANNPGQDYKVLYVPPLRIVLPDDLLEQIGVTFRLRPDEAIVYVGPTPPRCDYFSFTPFVSVRRLPQTIIPKGDWIVAAVSDPLNNALIRTEGTGNPFRKQTIVVFTADRGTFDRVAAAAQAAGYPASMINAYVLPSERLHLGTQFRSDTMLVVLRTANFASQAEGNAYLDDGSYARVWRVTPGEPATLDPFPTPPPRQRSWIGERTLFPGLEAALDRLEAAIVARTRFTQVESFGSIRWWLESRDVLANDVFGSPGYHVFVAGEASDTPYLRTARDGVKANFVLGADDMVVVYGVNHAATGQATYSSFGVYGDWVTATCDPAGQWEYLFGCGNPIWNGVASMTSHRFTGSAAEYLGDDPMAPYLYAVKVLRRPPDDKHEKYWVVVPETAPPGTSPSHGVALDRPLTIGYRAYLNPVTHAGPSYDDIIWDRALWFRRR